MRFYDFQIFNNDGSPYSFKAGGNPGAQPPILAHWASLVNNQTDPGALNIEFDIPIFDAASTTANASLTLWGAGLSVLSQSSDLVSYTAPKKVLLSVGMSAGLPLANPNQHGSPFNFQIFQAFGNWIGVNQTLNFVLTASYVAPPASNPATPTNTPTQAAPTATPAPTAATGAGSTNAGLLSAVAVTPYVPLNPNTPVNIQFTWTQGQTLAAAIQATLSAAFPGAALNIAISANLVSYVTQIGYYQTLQQFAAAMKALSLRNMNSTTYQGVSISQRGNTLDITDNTGASTTTAGAASPTPANASATSGGQGNSASNPIQIAFTDLVGQPVWHDLVQLQFMTIMRGDIYPAKYIKMPQNAGAITTSSASSQSALRSSLVFQGVFLVKAVRLVGNFRAPNPESWVTVITAVLQSTVPLGAQY